MKRLLHLILAATVVLVASAACNKTEYGNISVKNNTKYNFTECKFSFVNTKNSTNVVAVEFTGPFLKKGFVEIPQHAKFFNIVANTDDGHYVITYDIKASDGMQVTDDDIRIVSKLGE